jgi:signal transduction histidine kinase
VISPVHPALEALRDGFITLDADGRVTYWNAVAERLLATKREAVLGRIFWECMPDLCEPHEWDALRQALRDREPRWCCAISPGQPEREVAAYVSPMDDGGMAIQFTDGSTGEGTLPAAESWWRAVGEMETRRWPLSSPREHDLARAAAEAEAADRAKSRFFAAVSHELRTPLNAIVGYTHLLSSGTYGEIPSAAQRAADRAGVCAEHLARLVDDVLLLTTTEIGRLPVAPGSVELDHLLSATAEPLRHQAEAKGLRFRIEVAAATPTIETDPDRLRQLLHTLLGNAVKFTCRGEIHLGARPGPGETVDLHVADTGPGVPFEERERIFAPFEQLGDPARSDSMRQGTGLGLTVARQLTTLLGGQLWVEGRTDGQSGAVFRLRLPVRFDPPPA